MLKLTKREVELREKKRATFHEVGHAHICRVFGGYGTPEVWRNSAKNVANGEMAWRGRFKLVAEPGTIPYDDETKQLLGILPAPENWKVLFGLAGLVAEFMADGETCSAVIFEGIHEKIAADEVSQTDLDFMGSEFDEADVSMVANILAAGWKQVELEANTLTD